LPAREIMSVDGVERFIKVGGTSNGLLREAAQPKHLMCEGVKKLHGSFRGMHMILPRTRL
jgi:hypothetical protein